jgi:hypothetical protein
VLIGTALQLAGSVASTKDLWMLGLVKQIPNYFFSCKFAQILTLPQEHFSFFAELHFLGNPAAVHRVFVRLNRLLTCGETLKVTISLLEHVLSQKLLRVLTSRECERQIFGSHSMKGAWREKWLPSKCHY